VPAQLDQQEQSYSREDVRRVLAVSERTLRSWERHQLIPESSTFGFSDLIALRAIVNLRKSKIPPQRIRRALTSLRSKLREMRDPLREVRIFLEDGEILVQVAGRKMEPVSGQLLLDFDHEEISRLLAFPQGRTQAGPSPAQKRTERASAERWFQRGLQLEQTGAPVEQIIEAYKHAAEYDPGSAGALVNLGTVYFNLQSWVEAEHYYGRAIEVEPDYPLAHFNIANLYDETGRRADAVRHYQIALELNPQYADAHYNLALLFQNQGMVLKAVHHWKSYVKLDPSSEWAHIARRELDKLRRATLVKGNARRDGEAS
jgi:tetratricopeptide (TPR) repeat protein